MVISVLLFIFLFIIIPAADALLRIVAPLDASEIQFWVGNPSLAFFAASSDIVFEELCGGAAYRAADLENILFFPVAYILSRTFHPIIIISISPPDCNGAKESRFKTRDEEIIIS